MQTISQQHIYKHPTSTEIINTAHALKLIPFNELIEFSENCRENEKISPLVERRMRVGLNLSAHIHKAAWKAAVDSQTLDFQEKASAETIKLETEIRDLWDEVAKDIIFPQCGVRTLQSSWVPEQALKIGFKQESACRKFLRRLGCELRHLNSPQAITVIQNIRRGASLISDTNRKSNTRSNKKFKKSKNINTLKRPTGLQIIGSEFVRGHLRFFLSSTQGKEIPQNLPEEKAGDPEK